MSLREEIKIDLPCYKSKHHGEAPVLSDGHIDRLINKVLDAAVDAAKERLIGVSEAQGAKRDKLSMIVAGNSMIDEINKLRGE